MHGPTFEQWMSKCSRTIVSVPHEEQQLVAKAPPHEIFNTVPFINLDTVILQFAVTDAPEMWALTVRLCAALKTHKRSETCIKADTCYLTF